MLPVEQAMVSSLVTGMSPDRMEAHKVPPATRQRPGGRTTEVLAPMITTHPMWGVA